MIQKLIQKLREAKKLHRDDIRSNVTDNTNRIHEKDVVIHFLKKKSLTKREKTKAKNIIKDWIFTHEWYLPHVRAYPAFKKHWGSLSWHKQWIALYHEILKELEAKG